MKNFNSNYQKMIESWLEDSGVDYKCYGNRLYNKGNNLFSYGDHFKLAKKVAENRKMVVYLNIKKYSHTTTKQQNKVAYICSLKGIEVKEIRPEHNSRWE